MTAGVPETVTVDHPGNSPDASGYGAVAYAYRIGKFEVTNTEYCAFLNATTKTRGDTLYDPRMAGEYGGITRSGSPGNYAYAVKSGMGDKPVNYVMWETALRYANWLTNGRGDGDTETGSYRFEGGRPQLPNHAELAAGPGVKWVLPTENEWYKAAYYDPQKPGGAGYWRYATRSDEVPQVNINSNIPMDVGKFDASAHGSHGQNGNLWEWNETRNGNKVGLRGGSFFLNDNETYLRSSTRYEVDSAKWPNYGFRVAALGTGRP
ncbi:MAG: formylglycine-generating enzyme family protein [Phycisphaerae bacterium]|nr:formylglycine-generating enzyme family protein [Phycisphaerae bacterium]